MRSAYHGTVRRVLAAAYVVAICAFFTGCLFGPDGEVPSSVEEALTDSLIDSTDDGATDEPANGSTDESNSNEVSAPPPNLPGTMDGNETETEEDCEFSQSSHCAGSGDTVGGIGHGTPQPHDSTPEPGSQSDEDD